MRVPPVKLEWNINTIIQLVTFGILLAGMVWTTAQRDADLTVLSGDFDEYKVQTNGRLMSLEGLPRQIDSLSFRLGAAETTNASITKSLADLQAAVALQSGDLKVVKEILQRIERQSSPAVFAPMASME